MPEKDRSLKITTNWRNVVPVDWSVQASTNGKFVKQAGKSYPKQNGKHKKTSPAI